MPGNGLGPVEAFIDGVIEPIFDALLASWRRAFTFTTLRVAALAAALIATVITVARLDSPMLFSLAPVLPVLIVFPPVGIVYFARNVGRFVRAARLERLGQSPTGNDIPRHPYGMLAPALDEVWPHDDADAIWARSAEERDASIDTVGLSFGIPAAIVVAGLFAALVVGIEALAIAAAAAGGVIFLGRRRINRVRAEICRRLVDDRNAGQGRNSGAAHEPHAQLE